MPMRSRPVGQVEKPFAVSTRMSVSMSKMLSLKQNAARRSTPHGTRVLRREFCGGLRTALDLIRSSGPALALGLPVLVRIGAVGIGLAVLFFLVVFILDVEIVVLVDGIGER